MAPMTDCNSEAQKGGGVALYINNIHFFSATEKNDLVLLWRACWLKQKEKQIEIMLLLFPSLCNPVKLKMWVLLSKSKLKLFQRDTVIEVFKHPNICWETNSAKNGPRGSDNFNMILTNRKDCLRMEVVATRQLKNGSSNNIWGKITIQW